jgi:hypothetical protein
LAFIAFLSQTYQLIWLGRVPLRVIFFVLSSEPYEISEALPFPAVERQVRCLNFGANL